MTDWQDHAHRLAAHLDQLGVLAPGWRSAFESVPRHVFVPSFYQDDGGHVAGDDPETRQRWLEAVYRDESLITQMMTVPGTDMQWPTSSSTMPSLMARMLGLLDVDADHTVLEIGLGTGYNAALMCHRLGDDRVASIDIDPSLVALARHRLADAGYRPYLAAGDGATGIEVRGPYDRIIATCAVPSIPAAWTSQLRLGGRIVADIRGELSSALAVLTKTSPDTVEGRFLAMPGHFMWLRARADNPLRGGGDYNTIINMDGAETSPTRVAPEVLDDPEFQFMITLLVPGMVSAGCVDRDAGRVHVVRSEDGSWAEITPATGGGYQVIQGGDRRLWTEIESAAHTWAGCGRPDRSRFGLTASGRNQIVWLDTPADVVAKWEG